jgi:hypothetical protein
VTAEVTKTGPERLRGGGDKRRAVGCIHLRMHHCLTTNRSWGDEAKDGAVQEGTAPYRAERKAQTGSVTSINQPPANPVRFKQAASLQSCAPLFQRGQGP